MFSLSSIHFALSFCNWCQCPLHAALRVLYLTAFLHSSLSSGTNSLYRAPEPPRIAWRFWRSQRVTSCGSLASSLMTFRFLSLRGPNIAHDGRSVVGVSHHKTAAMQIATFALTQEEDAVSYLPAKFHYHLCLEGTYIVCRSIRQVLVPTVAPDVL